MATFCLGTENCLLRSPRATVLRSFYVVGGFHCAILSRLRAICLLEYSTPQAKCIQELMHGSLFPSPVPWKRKPQLSTCRFLLGVKGVVHRLSNHIVELEFQKSIERLVFVWAFMANLVACTCTPPQRRSIIANGKHIRVHHSNRARQLSRVHRFLWDSRNTLKALNGTTGVRRDFCTSCTEARLNRTATRDDLPFLPKTMPPPL